MIIAVLIVVLVVVGAIGTLILLADDCPREVAGHPCKGNRCDHSDEAMKQARRAKGGW